MASRFEPSGINQFAAALAGLVSSGENEKVWHDLVEALPAAIYITDAAGRITFYNEAAAEMWGCHPEIGKSEWCGSWKLYWADGTPLPHDECPMAVTLKKSRCAAWKRSPSGRTARAYPSCPIPRRCSTPPAAGRRRQHAGRPHRPGARRKFGCISSIVKSSDDAIISKDFDGIITSWNKGAEQLFGYTPDEMIGKPVTVLMPPDRLDEETDILGRIRRGERIDHYETIRLRKDGSCSTFRLPSRR